MDIEKFIGTFLHHELFQMPPQHLIFLHSSQQHAIGHFLHALAAVQYQTEASGIFSSSQKGDFSATGVVLLNIICYISPRYIGIKKQKRENIPYSNLYNNLSV